MRVGLRPEEENHLDRASRLASQSRRHRFDVDNGLAAKAAANLHGNGFDLSHRHVQEAGSHLANVFQQLPPFVALQNFNGFHGCCRFGGRDGICVDVE